MRVSFKVLGSQWSARARTRTQNTHQKDIATYKIWMFQIFSIKGADFTFFCFDSV